MTVSKRTRAKGVQGSQRLLPEAQVRGYVVGRAGTHPTYTAWVMLGSAISFGAALWLLTGAVVVPGGLLFVGLHHLLCPPRSLVVCDQGVAVLSRSFLNGQPNRVLGRAHTSALRPVKASGRHTQVAVGSELIWLTKPEDEQLRQALVQSSAPSLA